MKERMTLSEIVGQTAMRELASEERGVCHFTFRHESKTIRIVSTAHRFMDGVTHLPNALQEKIFGAVAASVPHVGDTTDLFEGMFGNNTAIAKRVSGADHEDIYLRMTPLASSKIRDRRPQECGRPILEKQLGAER